MSDNAYTRLVEKFTKIAQLDHALTFLQWDQLVMMPPAGNDSRSSSIAELASMRHQLLSEKELGDLIEEAKNEKVDDETKRSVLEMERQWSQAICLPAELVRAQSLAGSKCELGWRSQRKENDWDGFLENFREVVSLSREEAQLRQAVDSEGFNTPYDALLDLYCTGDSSDFISEVFTGLKRELPDLLQQVIESQEQPVSLEGNYPIKDQEKLNKKLLEILGFDFKAGRLDVSMHPFSTGDKGDQRITTRFTEDGFGEALMGTAHETGHASYEAGLPDKWRNLPIGDSRNMCIHESQSLLFEKQIFLSKAFVSYFTKYIHEELKDCSQFGYEKIWHALKQVKPGLIRVDADEVTYPLHVILRFEIERDLINGVIEAQDIPDLWDLKMSEYLGFSTKGNYKDGCLQDIHWTDGSFGYFPSYTLGALNSVQIFSTIQKENPDWEERFAHGDIGFVRKWLGENIWSIGSSLDSQEIIKRATGETTNPIHFLDHIRKRYIENRY